MRYIVDEMIMFTESRSVVKISVVVSAHFEFESKDLLPSCSASSLFLRGQTH